MAAETIISASTVRQPVNVEVAPSAPRVVVNVSVPRSPILVAMSAENAPVAIEATVERPVVAVTALTLASIIAAGAGGSGSLQIRDVSGDVDGVETVFAHGELASVVAVFRNGDLDFQASISGDWVTFPNPPQLGDTITLLGYAA